MPIPPSRRRPARLRLPAAPKRLTSGLALLALASLASAEARAEGSTRLGVTQPLVAVEFLSTGTAYNSF